MAWALFHRRVRIRVGRLTYEVQPAPYPQLVKRLVADRAIELGAAIGIDGMTRDRARSRRAPAGAATERAKP
jgi:hypothetical protein